MLRINFVDSAADSLPRLPAVLHSPLQSAGLFGGAWRGLHSGVSLRGLAEGRFRRGTDWTLLQFSGVLLREAGPGLAVVLI